MNENKYRYRAAFICTLLYSFLCMFFITETFKYGTLATVFCIIASVFILTMFISLTIEYGYLADTEGIDKKKQDIINYINSGKLNAKITVSDNPYFILKLHKLLIDSDK